MLRLAVLNSRAHNVFRPWFYRFSQNQRWAATHVPAVVRRLPLRRMHHYALRRYRALGCFDTALEGEYLGWMDTPRGRRTYVDFFANYHVPAVPGLADSLVQIAVIWGDRDPYIPFRTARELAERIPGATLTRLRGGDHYIIEERPEEATDAVGPPGTAPRGLGRSGYSTRVTVTRDIRASRRQVWDVMADGWTYSQWVVGNSRMRAVDPNWPAPGSTIRHSIGVWPLVIDDETTVEKSVPMEELVLHAKGGPFGGARVMLRLSDIPDGCRVVMDEYPVSGPGAVLPNRLSDIAAWPRNRETLWRLGALAQRLKPTELTDR